MIKRRDKYDEDYNLRSQKVILFDDEKNVLNILDVEKIEDDSIFCFNGVYDRKMCDVYVNDVTNDLYYVSNFDVESRQEASNLKNLRKSMVIKNLLDYKVDGISFMSIIPYIIIIIMIIANR